MYGLEFMRLLATKGKSIMAHVPVTDRGVKQLELQLQSNITLTKLVSNMLNHVDKMRDLVKSRANNFPLLDMIDTIDADIGLMEKLIAEIQQRTQNEINRL